MKNTMEQSMSNEEIHIMNDYYKDNARKLHKIVNMVVDKKFGGTSDKDMDAFYSEATEVFVDILKNKRYDPLKGDFTGFLYRSLNLAFIDMLKAKNRDKRMQKVVVNINGKEKRVPVENLSLDVPISEDSSCTIGDCISSGFDMYNALSESCGMYDDKIEIYLNSLSNIQRQIVEMKMDGFTNVSIKENLGLSEKEFQDNMKSIRQNKMISLFNKSHKQTNFKNWRENKMDKDIDYDMNEIMELDTTDSYRRDNCTLKSLLEDIGSGEIDRHYISQRAALVWEDEQINKFYSRVLNNQPVPEIVLCETSENGEKICYLVEGLQRLSYSEEFKENRIPIKAKGAEFVNIRYKKYEYDAKGKKILDENGRAKYTLDIFNIVGKYYRDLPEFLQRRFDNYNIIVTRYFNCNHKMIDYHIRNYNNHVAMTKSQYGITNVSNNTSRRIKAISEDHTFFKNNIKCSNKNRKKGVLDEVVARSIMAVNFLNDWKKDLVETLKFLDKNVTDQQYERFVNNLTRLSKIVDRSMQDIFTTTNGHVWLAVYDEFVNLGVDDKRFVDFMNEFKKSLHEKIIDGFSYDMVNKRNTRDKSVVVSKITVIKKLMYVYLHIEKEELNVLEFVKQNVSENITKEDIEEYEEVLDVLTLNVDNSSELMDEKNRNSLVGIVAYSFENDIDLDDWIVHYFKRNNTYIRNQKENYLHMKKDLNNFELKRIAMSA